MACVMDRRFLLLVFMGIIGLGTVRLKSGVESDKTFVIDPPDEVSSWVVHEESGRVFASLANKDEVVEYGPAANEVRRFKVGKTPTAMILKRDYLIVACDKSSSLYVIDLKTNSNLGAVEGLRNISYGLFCSQVDNGYVYGVSVAENGSEVCQIDLKKMKVCRQKTERMLNQTRFIMSRNGEWIVNDLRAANSGGVSLMKFNEEELTITPIRNERNLSGQAVAGPYDRYWTFGGSLYSINLAKPIRKFSGSPVAIHPRLDLVVSKTSEGLVLERFSDAVPIETVSLKNISHRTLDLSTDRLFGKPAQAPFIHTSSVAAAPPRPPFANLTQYLLMQSRNSPINEGDSTIQFDLKNNLIFLGNRLRGYWIDLGKYADKLSPLTIVQAPLEVESLVGNPLRVPFSIINGGEKTKLTIAQGPKTAKLEDHAFVWQPQSDHIGFTNVQLVLKSTDSGRTLDTVDMSIHVKFPEIDLGFRARAMDLAPNKRFLLVWGATSSQIDHPSVRAGAEETLAIIDIAEMKVLARKVYPQGIRCATIDDDYVYLSPNSGSLLYRLDQSLSHEQRAFLSSVPTQLVRIGKDQLLVAGEQIQVFNTETVKPVPRTIDDSRIFSNNVIRFLDGNKIQLGGQIIDQATGAVVGSTGISNLPVLSRANPPERFKLINDGQTALLRWGRTLKGNSLTDRMGKSICQWPSSRYGILSQRGPMAILIASVQDANTTALSMEFANLIDGMVQQTMILERRHNSARSNPSFFTELYNKLITAGDKLLLLYETRLLVITIPQNVADAMAMPTYFLEKLPNEIDADKPAKVKLEIGGKTENVTFSLIQEQPFILLNSRTGELTLDTPQIWNAYSGFLANHNDYPSFLRENAKEYERLTGRSLPREKIAAQIPIFASAKDPEGQEDIIRIAMIVVGPRKSVDDMFAARQAESAAMRAENEKRQAEAKLRATALQGDAKADKKMIERMDALESQMRRLEAVLDSILKRLDKQ